MFWRLLHALVMLSVIAQGMDAHAQAPQISIQPPPVSVADGEDALFSVGARGTAPLSFQWLKNGISLAGKTSGTIQLTGVQLLDAGLYQCVVSNVLGMTTSAPVRLIVTVGVAPQFPAFPTIRNFQSGNAGVVSIGLTAASRPLTYQWFKSGAPLADATNQTFNIANVQFVDAGVYHLAASNYAGMATSAPVHVNVLYARPSAYRGRLLSKIADNTTMKPGRAQAFGSFDNANKFTLRDGKVHFLARIAPTSPTRQGLYRWENGALATLADDTAPVPGAVPDTFYHIDYPTDDAAGVMHFTGTYNNGLTTALFRHSGGQNNIEVDAATLLPGGRTALGFAQNARRDNALVWASTTLPDNKINFFLKDATGIRRLFGGGDDLPGVMTTVTGLPGPAEIGFDGTHLLVGVQDEAGHEGFFTSSTTGALTKIADFSDPIPGAPGFFFNVVGDVDTDGEYRFLTAGSRLCAFQGTTLAAIITSTPYPYVSAGGSRQVYYARAFDLRCWTDGVDELVLNSASPIDGSTLTNIRGVDGHGNDVIVSAMLADGRSGLYGFVGPGAPGPPVLVTSPTNLISLFGVSQTFVCIALGQNLTYQWSKNNVPIDGATSSSLTLNTIDADSVGSYAVTVSNPSGTVAGGPAALTVLPPVPPAFAKPLLDQQSTVGAQVIFSPSISGSPPLAFQWRFGSQDIEGATNASLVLANVQPAQSGYYTLTMANSTAVTASATAALLVEGGSLPLPLVLGTPVYASGHLTFNLPTVTGKTYKVWFTPSLTMLQWSEVQTVIGNGTVQVLTVGTEGTTGFFRVQQIP